MFIMVQYFRKNMLAIFLLPFDLDIKGQGHMPENHVITKLFQHKFFTSNFIYTNVLDYVIILIKGTLEYHSLNMTLKKSHPRSYKSSLCLQ